MSGIAYVSENALRSTYTMYVGESRQRKLYCPCMCLCTAKGRNICPVDSTLSEIRSRNFFKEISNPLNLGWYISMWSAPVDSSHLRCITFNWHNGLGHLTTTSRTRPPSITRTVNWSDCDTPEGRTMATEMHLVVVSGSSHTDTRCRGCQSRADGASSVSTRMVSSSSPSNLRRFRAEDVSSPDVRATT